MTGLTVQRSEVIRMLIQRAIDVSELREWFKNLVQHADSPRVLLATHEPDGKKYYEGYVDKFGGVGGSYVIVRTGSGSRAQYYTVPLSTVHVWANEPSAIADLKKGLPNSGYRAVGET
jgi:hypothetical protein